MLPYIAFLTLITLNPLIKRATTSFQAHFPQTVTDKFNYIKLQIAIMQNPQSDDVDKWYAREAGLRMVNGCNGREYNYTSVVCAEFNEDAVEALLFEKRLIYLRLQASFIISRLNQASNSSAKASLLLNLNEITKEIVSITKLIRRERAWLELLGRHADIIGYGNMTRLIPLSSPRNDCESTSLKSSESSPATH